MDPKYFERLHQAEARHAEWRMLDEALQKSTRKACKRYHALRVVVGHWLLRVGMRLTGEPVVGYTMPVHSSHDKHDAQYRYN